MYKSFTSKAIFPWEWQVKKSSDTDVNRVKNRISSSHVGAECHAVGTKNQPPKIYPSTRNPSRRLVRYLTPKSPKVMAVRYQSKISP